MQMLGGEGVSARLKNTWCVCSKAPRSCPCACKCRCTAGDKPRNKSGGIAASPANTKGHLPDIFSKTGHRISVKFGKTLCTCGKHKNSDLQEKNSPLVPPLFPAEIQRMNSSAGSASVASCQLSGPFLTSHRDFQNCFFLAYIIEEQTKGYCKKILIGCFNESFSRCYSCLFFPFSFERC